jgi:hypothetical protein
MLPITTPTSVEHLFDTIEQWCVGGFKEDPPVE